MINRSNLINEIEKKFKGFTEGIRVLMLINREISNSNKVSKRWINKIITRNHDEWINAVNILLDLQYKIKNHSIRLYACVNDRKLYKAINMFQHKQLDLIPDQLSHFYKNLNERFCSFLMKPENKNSKFFLLDIDSKDTCEVDKFISDNLIQVVKTYPSKNGWHYIVEPFNIKIAFNYKTFEVKNDGLLLINFL